jgi:hypothetical protein
VDLLRICCTAFRFVVDKSKAILHCNDLLWICWKVENLWICCGFAVRLVVQQIHNKSNKWSLSYSTRSVTVNELWVYRVFEFRRVAADRAESRYARYLARCVWMRRKCLMSRQYWVQSEQRRFIAASAEIDSLTATSSVALLFWRLLYYQTYFLHPVSKYFHAISQLTCLLSSVRSILLLLRNWRHENQGAPGLIISNLLRVSILASVNNAKYSLLG